jgi:hypothetical protein
MKGKKETVIYEIKAAMGPPPFHLTSLEITLRRRGVAAKSVCEFILENCPEMIGECGEE